MGRIPVKEPLVWQPSSLAGATWGYKPPFRDVGVLGVQFLYPNRSDQNGKMRCPQNETEPGVLYLVRLWLRTPPRQVLEPAALHGVEALGRCVAGRLHGKEKWNEPGNVLKGNQRRWLKRGSFPHSPTCRTSKFGFGATYPSDEQPGAPPIGRSCKWVTNVFQRKPFGSFHGIAWGIFFSGAK